MRAGASVIPRPVIFAESLSASLPGTLSVFVSCFSMNLGGPCDGNTSESKSAARSKPQPKARA
jgi:hypothetical protein